MKREILFKAKDFKGNWQIGSYYYGVMYPTSFRGHYINDEQIDEKTICQFTGAVDKKGVKIFENDKDYTGLVIRWNQLHFQFGLFNDNGATKKELLCSPYKTAIALYDTWTDDTIEIVGNIYDTIYEDAEFLGCR